MTGNDMKVLKILLTCLDCKKINYFFSNVYLQKFTLIVKF